MPTEQQPSNNNPFMQLRPWIVVQDDSSAVNKQIMKQSRPFITSGQEGFQPVMTLPINNSPADQVNIEYSSIL